MAATTTTPWYKDTDLLSKVVVPAAGAGLQAYGNISSANKNRDIAQQENALNALLQQQRREQEARQATAEGANNLFTTGQNDQFRRASNYLDQTPVGWAQNFERKNALLEALIPGFAQKMNSFSNLGVSPVQMGDLGRFMESVGKGATAASIGDRERGLQQLMQGRGPMTTMSDLSQIEQSRAWSDALRQQADEKEALNQQYVMGALEGNLNQAADWRKQQEAEYQKRMEASEKKDKGGGSWWKTALSFAPIALAPFTGGLSLAAQAGLGAALGAGTSLATGGGVKGALLGAAGGGLAPGAGAIAGKVGGNALQQALTKAGVRAAAGGLTGGVGGAMMGAGTSLAGSYGAHRDMQRNIANANQNFPVTSGAPNLGPAALEQMLPPPPTGTVGQYQFGQRTNPFGNYSFNQGAR